MDDVVLAGALAAAQRGDEVGFEVLWRAMQPAVLRYLTVVAGEAAEDMASETWLQVARDLRSFRGDLTSFRVWVFRIARHRGLDERRRVARRREDLYDAPPEGPAMIGDSAELAHERFGTAWALSLIATLPRDQAEVVMLRAVAGLDVRQTAEVLGKRSGAVRVAALRGLRRLAQHLEVQQRYAERRRPAIEARLTVEPPIPAPGVTG